MGKLGVVCFALLLVSAGPLIAVATHSSWQLPVTMLGGELIGATAMAYVLGEWKPRRKP